MLVSFRLYSALFVILFQLVLKMARTVGNLARDRLTVWEFSSIL